MSPPTQRPPHAPLVPPGGSSLHARDMVAIFSADLTLAAAQQALAAHEQWLPIDGDPRASLGNLVQSNSTGPLRLGYGAWRDLLLGAQFLNGRGELITAGGITVKNVAGYDLTKFVIGQRGIFAKLVTITTRTYRRPAGSILARLGPDVATVNQLLPSPLRPQWMTLTSNALWCGYLGDERTLDYYAAQLPQLKPVEVARRTLAQDVAFRGATWRATGEVTFRAAVPPLRVLEFAKHLNDPWAADAAFGIVVGGCQREQIDSIRQAAASADGSISFCDAEGNLLEPELNDLNRKLLERLKYAFDPDQRLAPLPWKD